MAHRFNTLFKFHKDLMLISLWNARDATRKGTMWRYTSSKAMYTLDHIADKYFVYHTWIDPLTQRYRNKLLGVSYTQHEIPDIIVSYEDGDKTC